MTKKEIKKVERVFLNDYSDYVSEKSRNGGCYGFWTVYTRVSESEFVASYGTTADMSYCPVCGFFNDHYEGENSCYESGYWCGEFERVSEAELFEIINNFKEDEDHYVEINLQQVPDMTVF